MFAARGPGIRKGLAIDDLAILDVAPIVLHSLRLAIPEDMEGAVPASLYDKPAAAKATIRRRSDAVRSEDRNEIATVTGLSQEDEEIVLARLRELGYME
jgi:hypothetical protein